MSIKKLILTTVSAVAIGFISTLSSAANFVAGQDYTVLPNPQPVEKAGKIEVREFFWYGCPHCHALEPHMQTWLRKLPKDVRFVRTPAPLGGWEVPARAYYASEELGVRQYTHLPLFDLHVGKNLSQQQLAQFFTKYKVSEDKFNSTYNSFAVTNKVAQAKKLMQAYQLSGVPAIVVNGKYLVKGETEKVPQVIDFLINKERKK